MTKPMALFNLAFFSSILIFSGFWTLIRYWGDLPAMLAGGTTVVVTVFTAGEAWRRIKARYGPKPEVST